MAFEFGQTLYTDTETHEYLEYEMSFACVCDDGHFMAYGGVVEER